MFIYFAGQFTTVFICVPCILVFECLFLDAKFHEYCDQTPATFWVCLQAEPNHRIPGFLKKNDEFQSLLVIPQYRKDQWHHFITITNKKRVVQWFEAMTSRKHPSDFLDPSPGGAQL